MSNCKILIIGSEGFIGKHCVTFFKKWGNHVVGADLVDLKESNYPYYKVSRIYPEFGYLFGREQFDICINAAGSGSVPHSIARPSTDFEANTVDVFNLLETIRVQDYSCNYVNISSAAVYGNPGSLPINEESLINPLSPYGWHKYYSELICREYSGLYGLKTCSIRPFSVYGAGLTKQLFWDLYLKRKQSDTIELYGTGDETRDFIYIDDFLSALNCIINNSELRGEVFNIGTSKQITIETATDCFFRVMGLKTQVVFNGIEKKGDPLHWRADISKLQNLGFRVETSLEEGLSKVTKWLKEKG